MSESQTKAGNQRKFENLKKLENFGTFRKMLESRPEDALVKLVKLVNIVKLVKQWRLY